MKTFRRLLPCTAMLAMFACGGGTDDRRGFDPASPTSATDPNPGLTPPPPGCVGPGCGPSGDPSVDPGDPNQDPNVPPADPGGPTQVDPSGQTIGIMDDPNDDISFEWEETAPGSICRAGHYVGTFDGAWASSFTVVGVPIPVTGNVDMWLEESENGEFLEVSQGTVSGVADFAFPYEVEISGRLDCRTQRFENGRLLNGHYLVPGLPPVPWAGTVTASYDKQAGAFVGATWTGKEDANPVFGGDGTWTAGWVP